MNSLFIRNYTKWGFHNLIAVYFKSYKEEKSFDVPHCEFVEWTHSLHANRRPVVRLCTINGIQMIFISIQRPYLHCIIHCTNPLLMYYSI